VLRHSPVVVGEGACVRNYTEIGRIGMMFKVDIVDYSVSAECGGSRGSDVKYQGRQERGDGERRREWKKMAEKIIGKENGK
jgi:hypothetical protein